jgi:alcohol dehydrogenase class IV
MSRTNHTAREGMMLAATLGGMAFFNSSVALVHGMSRPIGALFHLPHGLSNAILLPTVTRYSIVAAHRVVIVCAQKRSH